MTIGGESPIIGSRGGDFADLPNVLDFDASSASFTAKFKAAAAWLKTQGGAVTNNSANTFVTPLHLQLPKGQLLVEDSIDLQNIEYNGWGIVGNGATLRGVCAGKTVLDLLGSRWGHFEGFGIVGDKDEAPAQGMQFGHSSTGSVTVGEGHSLRNVWMSGHFTRTGLYLLGSESNNWDNLLILNFHTPVDTAVDPGHCVIIDGITQWGAITDYAGSGEVAGTSLSQLQNIFNKPLWYQMAGGVPFWGSNFHQTTLEGGYLASVGGTSPAAIFYALAGNTFRDIRWRVHAESTGLTGLIKFDRSAAGTVIVRGLDLREQRSHATNAYIETSANILSLDFRACDLHIVDHSVVPSNGMFSDPAVVTVHAGHLHMPTPAQLDVSALSAIDLVPISYGDGTQSKLVNLVIEADAVGGNALTIQGTNNAASINAVLSIDGLSDSPAPGDIAARINLRAQTSLAAKQIYAGWQLVVSDPTDGAIYGASYLLAAINNTLTAVFYAGWNYNESLIPFRLPTYTVVGLPAAASYSRCMIYVSDGTSNKRLAISDGTNWRFPDGNVVS